MVRLATWAALAAVTAVVVGCGPAKELPEEVIRPADPGEKLVAVPVASEPKAKEYAEKAAKAFTAGKPELVAKGKASRLFLKGKQYKLDPSPVDSVRAIAAVWPDRFTATDERQANGRRVVVSAYLHRPRFAVVQDGREQEDIPNRAELERSFVADETAQHWMALLLPLTDPKAIVFDLRSGTFLLPDGSQTIPTQTLKLALGDLPVYQLTFDAKTDLLLRVEYGLTQFGSSTRKAWTMLDHKPGPNGVFLPSKMELRQNSDTVEEWAVDKWEFPANIPDAEFSPPRK